LQNVPHAPRPRGTRRQQLGHDATRRPHAGVGQDHRILLPRTFRRRASYDLAAALGEIGVARDLTEAWQRK
jgi:hypothetical protein